MALSSLNVFGEEVTEAEPVETSMEDPLGMKAEATHEAPKKTSYVEPKVEIEHEEEHTYTLSGTQGYPWIDRDGFLQIGVAAELTEEVSSDDIFAEAGASMMLLIDSKTEKSISAELEFDIHSLKGKYKSINEEAFDALKSIRKQVTLLKSFKNRLTGKNIDANTLKFSGKEQVATLAKSIKKTKNQTDSVLSNISAGAPGTLLDMMDNYKFKKHLLVTGDAGQGKTYLVDKFITDEAMNMVQEIGHEGIESVDLIGHMIKLQDGTFGWKDGSLAEAFRMAQTQKVVYFIDEMLRIPVRELNLLVGSLTPNSRNQLKLRTGRPMVHGDDGLVKGEEITVDAGNFWVIATTNQGAGYNTARIEEALKDRFRLFYQEMSEDDIAAIIAEKLKAHKATGVFLKSILSLIKKTEEVKATGNIPRAFTVRHLSEMVDTANSQADIKKKAFELVNNIVSVDSNGAFNKEQRAIVSNIIKTTL